MGLISKTLSLSIAGFAIKLYSNSELDIALDIGYTQFLIPNNIVLDSTEIEIISSIPDNLKNEDSVVFKSNDETKKLWHICSHESRYKVIVFNPLLPNVIQQIAIIDIHSKKWKIYAENSDQETVMPLAYPMGPLIMYYLTVANNAIMIHSSGIIDGKKGRLFSGLSGVGKSTMAGIWQKAGHTIINDDRLMLSIENNTIIMYNTPMFYDDVPKKNILNAIYLLKQTKENCITKLEGVEAMTRVLSFCIQHAYDKQFLEHHLQTIFTIYNTIPIYELGFKPDVDCIDFIRLHD